MTEPSRTAQVVRAIRSARYVNALPPKGQPLRVNSYDIKTPESTRGNGTYGVVFTFTDTDKTDFYPSEKVMMKKFKGDFTYAQDTVFTELSVARALDGSPHIMPFHGLVVQPIEEEMDYEVHVAMPAACEALNSWWFKLPDKTFIKTSKASHRPSFQDLMEAKSIADFSADRGRCMVDYPKRDFYFEMVAYQIVRGLYMMHAHGILHRDIKPANVLVLAQAGLPPYIMLADYGLATFMSAPNTKMTTNVYSELWRSPELLLAKGKNVVYGYEQDIWATGKLLLDMVHQKNVYDDDDIFEQDESTLTWVLTLLSAHVDAKSNQIQRNISVDRYALPPVVHKIVQASPMADNKPFAHLLAQMLDVDPQRRISAKDALKHPFFDAVRAGINRLFPSSADEDMEEEYFLVQREARLMDGMKWNALSDLKRDVQPLLNIVFKKKNGMDDDRMLFYVSNQEHLYLSRSSHNLLIETWALTVRLYDLLRLKKVHDRHTLSEAQMQVCAIYLADMVRNQELATELSDLLDIEYIQALADPPFTFVEDDTKNSIMPHLLTTLRVFNGDVCVPTVYTYILHQLQHSYVVQLTDEVIRNMKYIALACLSLPPMICYQIYEVAVICVHLMFKHGVCAPTKQPRTTPKLTEATLSLVHTHIVQWLQQWIKNDPLCQPLLLYLDKNEDDMRVVSHKKQKIRDSQVD